MSRESKIKLLVIEDDPDDKALIQHYLRNSNGCDLSFASSLKEADAIFEQRPQEIDLVLLDLGLPDSVGLETVDFFMNNHPGVAVVVLTGFDNESVGKAAIKAGAQDYLVKGKFKGSELEKTINYALERFSAARKMRLILETAQEAFVSINNQGVILDWNQAAEGMFGHDREQALGQNVLDLCLSKNEIHLHKDEFKNYLANPQAYPKRSGIQVFAVRKSGEEFPLEISLSVFEWKGEKIFNVFGKDITERKQLEQLKDDFVSIVSHEICTPIAVLQGVVANFDAGVGVN
ncbi:MAG: PAS domain S-box protein [Deltaproteobacteria bacterium]|nr:PAS domain S-box protein [Deltaproteobacteria bacterium]